MTPRRPVCGQPKPRQTTPRTLWHRRRPRTGASNARTAPILKPALAPTTLAVAAAGRAGRYIARDTAIVDIRRTTAAMWQQQIPEQKIGYPIVV